MSPLLVSVSVTSVVVAVLATIPVRSLLNLVFEITFCNTCIDAAVT